MADDSAYLTAIKRDPEKGFRMLMARFSEPVYWHIRRLVVSHSDAQDATQETFIRVFRSLDGFRGGCSLKVWVYRIATNEAMRLIGKRHGDNLPIDGDENAEVRGIAADEYVDYSDLEAVKLRDAILSLPPKQQLVFNMRYYDEMEYEEIARVTGSSASAAKANYHIAKEKIIRYMNNS